MAERPNIVFVHVDDLGFGELSCYSGGPFRGVVTERIDAFAGEGFRLTNNCPDSQCTPTRSALLTLDVRRDCHTEYLRRAAAFVCASVDDETPFFVDFIHSLTHMPVIPRDEFKGRTGRGDWADWLLELDSDFGTLLDLLDALDIADDTVVVFAGDNGPEDVLLWRGSRGYFAEPGALHSADYDSV